jgi:hypothetical protein
MRSFMAAYKLAEAEHYWKYAIDAVHMMGIAAPTAKERIEWNLRAIEMVNQHPEQKGWLHGIDARSGVTRSGQFRPPPASPNLP